MNEAETGQKQSVGFWFFLLHLVTIFGIALSNIFLGLTAVFCAARRKTLNWSVLAPGRAGFGLVLSPLLLYLLAFLVSAVVSSNVATSLEHLKDLTALATLPLAVVLVGGEVRVRRVVAWLDGLMWLLCLYGLVQFFLTDLGELNNRIPGPFSHYMTFSGVLLVGLCLVLSRLSSPTPRSSSVWGGADWVLLSLLLFTLGLTLTRSAWIAAGVVVAVALWFRSRRFLLGFVLVMVVGSAVTAVALPSFWARVESIGDLEDASNYDRLCMIWSGGKMIAQRPLFGLGPGLVAERYPIYRHPTSPRVRVVHLHNTIVHMASERGLISVLAYLWLMGGASWLAWTRFVQEGHFKGPRADLHVAVILTVVALNVAGLFEANWRDTEVQRVVLFVLALPLCLAPKP